MKCHSIRVCNLDILVPPLSLTFQEIKGSGGSEGRIVVSFLWVDRLLYIVCFHSVVPYFCSQLSKETLTSN